MSLPLNQDRYYDIFEGAKLLLTESVSSTFSPECGSVIVTNNLASLPDFIYKSGNQYYASTNNPSDVGTYNLILSAEIGVITSSRTYKIIITDCSNESIVIPTISDMIYYIENPYSYFDYNWSL